MTPKGGDILIDGIPIKEIGIESLRRLTGIVSQECILFNDTVFNNIAFGKEDVTEESVTEAAKLRKYEFIIQMENGYHTLP